MNTALLATAAVLGFLAFFEPCTIATHTLFAVRAHHDTSRQRSLALAQLMLTRTGLLALIFGSAAAIGLATLSTDVAIAALGMIGLVYLVSRQAYLPVPHLELFRLIPRHHGLPQGLKLGLTLPACTLPLVLIVGVQSAFSRQPGVAALAGLVFAVMFTLPTLWSSVRGLGSVARTFLGKAAALSPYITTALLWGTAFFLWQTGV